MSIEGVIKKDIFFSSPGSTVTESWLKDVVEFPNPPVGVRVEEAIILRSTCLSVDTTTGISLVSPLFIVIFPSLILTLNGIGDDVFSIPNLFSVHSLNHNSLFFPFENCNAFDMPQAVVAGNSHLAQSGFCVGIQYSLKMRFFGSNLPILFPVCSLNQNEPFESFLIQ